VRVSPLTTVYLVAPSRIRTVVLAAGGVGAGAGVGVDAGAGSGVDGCAEGCFDVLALAKGSAEESDFDADETSDAGAREEPHANKIKILNNRAEPKKIFFIKNPLCDSAILR